MTQEPPPLTGDESFDFNATHNGSSPRSATDRDGRADGQGRGGGLRSQLVPRAVVKMHANAPLMHAVLAGRREADEARTQTDANLEPVAESASAAAAAGTDGQPIPAMNALPYTAI